MINKSREQSNFNIFYDNKPASTKEKESQNINKWILIFPKSISIKMEIKMVERNE